MSDPSLPERPTLPERIAAAYEALPPQLQAAARFVLAHPDDIALLSMREQARRAGVPPVTLTRLARQLGFKDYAAFRDLQAGALRRRAAGRSGAFSTRAGRLQQDQKAKGEAALASHIGWTVADHIADSHDDAGIAALAEAARRLAAARRVYFLGQRSCHAVAFHAHYIHGLFRDTGVLLDGAGGTGADALRHAGKADVLLVVSLAPYSTASVEQVEFAAARGTAIVAITDSAVGPIAARAACRILVPTATPSFFHAVAPAFAAAETLVALVAARAGENALTEIRNAERQLGAFAAYWTTPSPRRKQKVP